MLRRVDWVLGVAVALFVALGAYLASGGPLWHEGVAAVPNNGHRVVDPHAPEVADGSLPLEPTCEAGAGVRLVFSSVRPNWILCVGDLVLPLMITSYASGVPSWPLALFRPWHRNDAFAMRRLWLIEGSVCLVALYRLVHRLADRRAARVTAFALATSSAFVVPCAFLVPFETAPLALTLVGLWLWLPEGRPGPVRLIAGAFVLGLALLANLKALFLFAPIGLVLWREGALKAAPPPGGLRTAMVAAFALGALPLLIFTTLDPGHGFAQQASWRLAGVVSNLRPMKLAAELGALFLYAADLPAQIELAAAGGAPVFHLSWLPMVVPVAWAMGVAAGYLFRRSWGGLVSASGGLMLLCFVAVSTLLYTQLPAGNYAPIFAVFGVCVGGMMHDLSRRGWPRLAMGLAALMCASTAWNLLHRGSFADFAELPFNARVQRALAEHLLSAPDREVPVLTATYNQAGVIDSLGHGALRTLIAHPLFEPCERDPSGASACVGERWRWVLSHRGALPLKVVVPVSASAVDHPREVIEALGPQLFDQARAAGLSAREEGRFLTPSGATGLVLYRVSSNE
jgi:hypothetical protein